MPLIDLVPWRYRSWHNWVKANANRFFGEVLRTPPIACAADSETEGHLLACQRDLNMALLALKSWLRFAPGTALVIHDDGSLTEQGCRTLLQHLPGSRIVRRAEADAALERVLPASVAQARRRNVFMLKLLDPNYFNRGRRTVLLDSDLVFLKPPEEVLAWLGGQDEAALYNRDPAQHTYRAPVAPSSPPPDWFNAGFLAYRDRWTIDQIVQAMQQMRYDLEDQTVYAYLLAGRPSVALDPTRYHVYQGGAVPAQARMVHFISTHRFTERAYTGLAARVCAELNGH